MISICSLSVFWKKLNQIDNVQNDYFLTEISIIPQLFPKTASTKQQRSLQLKLLFDKGSKNDCKRGKSERFLQRAEQLIGPPTIPTISLLELCPFRHRGYFLFQ